MPDLVLGSSGSLHAVYVDDTGSLVYAFRRSVGTAWVSEIVDAAYQSPRLAVDASGVVHIAYRRDRGDPLRHARRTAAGAYAIEDVDTFTTSSDARNFDIAVTSDRHVHIVYAHQAGARHAELAPCE